MRNRDAFNKNSIFNGMRLVLLAASVASLLSCGKATSFSSADKPISVKSPAQGTDNGTATRQPATSTSQGPNPNVEVGGVIGVDKGFNVVLDPGSAETIPGTNSQRPLAIYFVLDVTGSMASQIATVKNNIVSFVNNLHEKNFTPSLGLIPIRDSIGTTPASGDVREGRFDLSADVDAFKHFVGTLGAAGGGDATEASLLGIDAALGELMVKETRPDAVKVILAITDVPGHHGVNHNDCTLNTTETLFEKIPEDQKGLVKFFYSAASYPIGCSGFISGKSQFDALLSKIIPSVPLESRGGYVPWPFTASDLVEEFTSMLQKVTPPIDVVCLNKSAKLTRESGIIAEWNNQDLAANYQSFIANKKQSLSNAFLKADKELLLAGGGVVDLERCCVSVAAAKIGDFSTCLKNTSVSGATFTTTSP